jgi:seryl-tRNA synthetase
MLDLAFVRGNLPLVEEKLRARGMDAATVLGDFQSLDMLRRERITEAEQLKAQRNALSEEVGRLKRAGQDPVAIVGETRALREKTEQLERSAAEAEEKLRTLLAGLPNLPADDVPLGKSEHDNVVVSTWGELPQFDFTPKAHWELGESLGILDMQRGAKLSGARFPVYWAQGARLERALAISANMAMAR